MKFKHDGRTQRLFVIVQSEWRQLRGWGGVDGGQKDQKRGEKEGENRIIYVNIVKVPLGRVRVYLYIPLYQVGK